MRRTGIDLSPARCAIVDASTTTRWRKHGERSLLRVHNFATLDRYDNAQALTAELKVLADSRAFSQHVWVTLWDVRSSHHYVQLPAARRYEIGAIAMQHGASVLGLGAREIAIAIAEGPPSSAGAPDALQFSFFTAASDDLRSRLRPIRDAGFVVDGVLTPCGALWAQARLRRSAVPGAVHAYVALGAAMSALVIVSDGFLLYARELPWGYADSSVRLPRPLSRDSLTARLALELKRAFLYVKQYWPEDVSQVLLCGDMFEIRSLTAPLIERLNLEVETLDSLDGIDTSALPEPADQFTEQVASFRLAAAIAAEPPPVNLLPRDVNRLRANRAGQIVFAGGAAAAVAFGAFLYGQADVRAQSAERAVAALQREVRQMEPSARAVQVIDRGAAADTAEQSAPDALDLQGRMARILEALSVLTSSRLTLKSIQAVPDGAAWRVSIEVATPFVDPVKARLTIDSFLQNLERSPLFGVPVSAPRRRTFDGASELGVTVEYLVSK